MSKELDKLELPARLWPGSPQTLSARLACLSRAALGNSSLALPSGLRTGGATFVFQSCGEDLNRLLWKGRWRDVRLLGIYVQELAAATVRMRLDAEASLLVEQLAALYEALLEESSDGE